MRCSVFLPLLAVSAVLAGCNETQSRYPSLLPRPIESMDTSEPVRPVPVATPDPALDAQIATINARLAEAEGNFTRIAQTAEARVAVASGTPAGSDPWLDAQTALAELDTTRAPIVFAAADLERLAIDRGKEGKPPYPALDTALAAADALVERQATRTRTLTASLAGTE